MKRKLLYLFVILAMLVGFLPAAMPGTLLSVARAAPGVGDIITVAGNGTAAFGGDGGAATAASLNVPHGVVLDGAGNLYIADRANHRIRKVDTSGIITTVAGTGAAGFSGDSGPATAASLNGPEGIAVDGTGNLFITDYENVRIRKVDAASGVITTVAGDGTWGFGGDDGPATAASLNGPVGVALDGAGNLFIADFENHRIRKVDTSGIISTVAGNGIAGYTGDGGPATAASLNMPGGVAIDGVGNLFILDTGNNRIRKVEGVAVPEVARNWTFMVYMAADNDLDTALVKDLNEMEVVGSTDNVSIVALLDRYGSGNTNIYYVTSDNDTNTINSPVVPGPFGAEVDMGDPNTLVSFVEWTMDNYPANNYALVLSDHGSGWRGRAIPEALTKGVAWDDTSGGTYIDTPELGTALATINTNTGVVLDIVGFDACSMQMVEIASEIEDYANIMVGSEEVEPVDGWPYNTILADLIGAPASTPQVLATTIVNQYMAYYGTSDIETRILWMLSSVSLASFTAALERGM
ncbi:clostripain-related cysteine peptidase [Chloroflexota bacterium]